jgi:hypothetical protein
MRAPRSAYRAHETIWGGPVLNLLPAPSWARGRALTDHARTFTTNRPASSSPDLLVVEDLRITCCAVAGPFNPASIWSAVPKRSRAFAKH